MRFVFDTNVLISGLLSHSSKSRVALDLALQRGKVLISLATLAELSEVLSRKKFRPYISTDDVHSFLAALARNAEWIEIVELVEICRDPTDDKFLELALNGHATHIVTGDSDLLTLHSFRGISILTPQSFLSAFRDDR